MTFGRCNLDSIGVTVLTKQSLNSGKGLKIQQDPGIRGPASPDLIYVDASRYLDLILNGCDIFWGDTGRGKESIHDPELSLLGLKIAIVAWKNAVW